MLTRALTAICLILFFLPLFLIGGITVYLMVALVGLLVHYEFTSLREKEIPKLVRLIVVVGYTLIPFLGAKFGIFFCVLLTFFMICIALWDESFKLDDVFLISTVCGFISFAAYSFLHVGLTHNLYMLIIAIITYFNDTGAYFVGYFFGKHKFNERVSPKKTWEGAIGGFISSIVAAVLCYFIFPTLMENLLNSFIFGVVLGVSGPMGDLMFSLIKRHFNVKDYGSFLPGHGGALDRIDSLLINFSIFFMLMEILL